MQKSDFSFQHPFRRTTFSVWFNLVRGLTNIVLTVLYHIPCSFLSGCLQTFKNSTKINHLKRGVYFCIYKSITLKLVISEYLIFRRTYTWFMKSLQQDARSSILCQMIRNQYKIEMVLSCFNMKFDGKGRFDLLSFATLVSKAEIYSSIF